MSDKPVNVEAWAPATYDMIASDWQLGPVDLCVPNSGKDMPDVHLEALCDIIFANLQLTSLPPRSRSASVKADR